MVRLLVSSKRSSPVSLSVRVTTLSRRSFSSSRMAAATGLEGCLSGVQGVTEGSSRPVRELNRGSRWRGQGMMWNSWGRRIEEVADLRDQQKHEGLAEVAQDADDDKDHAGEVAVCVPDEDARRVLVVREECEAHAQEGQEEVQAE